MDDKKLVFISKPFKFALVLVVILAIVGAGMLVLLANTDRLIRTPKEVLALYLEGIAQEDITKVAAALYPKDSQQYRAFIESNDDIFSGTHGQFGQMTEFEIENKLDQGSDLQGSMSFTFLNDSESEHSLGIPFTKYKGRWYLAEDIGINFDLEFIYPTPNHLRLTQQQRERLSTNDGNFKSYTVKSGEDIDNESFARCTYLNEIILPSDYPFFEAGNFSQNPNLVSIKIDGESPLLSTIDGVLYNKLQTKIVYFPRGKGQVEGSPDGEFHIPTTVTDIGITAFCNYSGQLKKIVLPSSVKTIERSAFYDFQSSNCQIILNEGLTKIEFGVFQRAQIDQITLPSTLEEIGFEAFRETSNLKSVIIPKNSALKVIGEAAFDRATNLLSIYLPVGVTEIKGWTFDSCNSLSEIRLHNNIKSIGVFAFRNCDSLSELYIPMSVEYIGKGAFQSSYNLKLDIQAASQPHGWHEDWDLGFPNEPNWGVKPSNT